MREIGGLARKGSKNSLTTEGGRVVVLVVIAVVTEARLQHQHQGSWQWVPVGIFFIVLRIPPCSSFRESEVSEHQARSRCCVS